MAEVAGPGKYARRTDKGSTQPARDITGGGYGEAKAMEEIQTAAPMSATPGIQRPQVTLSAPSQRPEEPIEAGSPFGPGPGPEVLPMAPSGADETAAVIRQLAQLYPDPDLVRLVQRLRYEGR